MTARLAERGAAGLRAEGPAPRPREPEAEDVLGIGFGPSNLALAIALDEASRGRPLRTRFLEQQPRFRWHGGMLLPQSDMQISFLKDLVTLRDPTSPYTFVNYLHVHGRLVDFVNLKAFHPSRIEFNDYLAWVAGHFGDVCRYGERVVAVEAEGPLPARRFRVTAVDADGRETRTRARALVLATGGTPNVPRAFAALGDAPQVFHASAYLDRVGGLSGRARPRVAVIGAGQTAAEIFLDLPSRLRGAEAEMIFRAHALKPSDDSAFVNEIFNPAFTDVIYAKPDTERQALLEEFRNTNYAVVNADLIARIYDLLYQQKVRGEARHALRPRHAVRQAEIREGAVWLDLAGSDGTAERRAYDAVVLATGYRRERLPPLLGPLRPYLEGDAIGRDYRLRTGPDLAAPLYLQGFSEGSHGLSDTLLSVIVARSAEIARSILALREEAP
ncbi:L-ornithine N(5)-monooxygenase [Methylobacterium crusticola]|uniref:L-ornithine N(5)-monooxygenase n=1 Tax=Methylobacterium crusticola TaxID=1697972 RepID=A0ABQ4R247_9HYPH|nr:lysine N(6)-hydroxylase/L-ornithine N(5)-oxygenase family protein [Methylobacterium crusticola]GJD51497.1 L-ornithine N(5)-monooxygenase [Methylobacterium crusticola]